MKIAMIGHKRIPSREGGIEIVVEELAVRMAAKQNDVTVYNRKSRHVAGKQFESGKKLKEYKGVKIITVPTPNSSKLNAIVYSAIATLKAVFKGYDVIHFHAEGPAAMCFLPKLFKIRTVVTIHGLDWARSKWGGFATKFLLFGERNAAKYADEIIVLSESVKQYFMDTYQRETTYIPNGISKPEIKEASVISKKYGLTKDGYILYLGRIVPEKGIHYLVEAYNKLNTEMPLVIAGGSSHTADYFNELKNSAKTNSKIIFTDFVQGQELEELYSNAYVYVLPSDLEGMPLSLLEAMSYGNCCITSDIPECTDVYEDKAVSFIKGNTEDLHNKLQMLCDNADLTKKYKTAASDYICSKYNWDDIAEQTLNIYGEIQ